MRLQRAIFGHEYINKLLKSFKIRKSKIALNKTLTLKLGVTLVLTVTRAYVFVNPPPRDLGIKKMFLQQPNDAILK